MIKFKKIILWANGNKSDNSSLRRALQIAEMHNARLYVVGIVEKVPQSAYSFLAKDGQLDLQSILVGEMTTYLEKILKKRKNTSIKMDTEVLIGTPYHVLIQEVINKKADLVITTAKEETEVNEIIFGSNAMHLMRKCPCPVMVLRPTSKRTIKKILVAVDVVSESSAELKMNSDLMKYALNLAELDNAEVHILHSWSIYGEYYLWNYTKKNEEEVRKIVDEIRGNHQQQLTNLVKKNAPQLNDKNIHLVKGDAAEVIPEMVTKIKADMIVMGTVGRVGLRGLFIGNTAEKVLHHVDCSVFAVKPDSFVSPVK